MILFTLFSIICIYTLHPPVAHSYTETYDVIVIGGEPEGVAAAIAAGRNGQKTLLIESRSALGGLFTFARMNYLDISNDMHGQPVNKGIFSEWHHLVGGRISFDVEDAKQAFKKLVKDEPNVTTLLNSEIISVDVKGNLITSITIEGSDKTHKTIKAKRYIDATQDADVAAKASVPYFIGNEDIGLGGHTMSATLMLQFDHVNWHDVKNAAYSNVFGGAAVSNDSAWGFPEIKKIYTPHFPNTALRGLNIARTNDGQVSINALQIFHVDGLDPESVRAGLASGQKEAYYVADFLKKHFPGFEQARLLDLPSELYIRETRHIRSLYQLPVLDVWENRDHWDRIALASYPIDIQARSTNEMGIILANPVQYAIPFRSIVPLKIRNLLVAGRSSGYSSLAAGSARVVPTGMSVGEAAGTAVSVSIEKQLDFHQMSQSRTAIGQLQSLLISKGANLYPFHLNYPYQGTWFDPAVKYLLNRSLISVNYHNQLPVNATFSQGQFKRFAAKAISRIYQEKGIHFDIPNIPLTNPDAPISRSTAATILLRLLGKPNPSNDNDPWEALSVYHIIDHTAQTHIKENLPLQGKDIYYLIYLAGVYIGR